MVTTLRRDSYTCSFIRKEKKYKGTKHTSAKGHRENILREWTVSDSYTPPLCTDLEVCENPLLLCLRFQKLTFRTRYSLNLVQNYFVWSPKCEVQYVLRVNLYYNNLNFFKKVKTLNSPRTLCWKRTWPCHRHHSVILNSFKNLDEVSRSDRTKCEKPRLSKGPIDITVRKLPEINESLIRP